MNVIAIYLHRSRGEKFEFLLTICIFFNNNTLITIIDDLILIKYY